MVEEKVSNKTTMKSFLDQTVLPGDVVLDLSSMANQTIKLGEGMRQVPLGLESETGIPLNKGNIYLSKTSPLTVQHAYWKQFKQDFSNFLKLRSDEQVPGGRMLLAFLGRKNDDPFFNENCTAWNLLASALKDMVLEGIVKESKLNSFNVPFYAASTKEIKNLIQAQGSFNLHLLDVFEINWDGTMDDSDAEIIIDKLARGENIARSIRAVTEPILVSHFGEAIIEDLFGRFKVKATELLLKGEAKYINLVVSLVKKA